MQAPPRKPLLYCFVVYRRQTAAAAPVLPPRSRRHRHRIGVRGWLGAPIRRLDDMAVDKNMRVLIVEDYKTMLRILRNLLNQLGFKNIEEASDGSEALHKLKIAPFDLIIADWNMEPMTGFQLLKEVRADEKLKKTPFIMVTAESKTENVVAAKQAGVSNYIVKPFSTETLKAKMTSVLGPF
jgi:two-component system chemotaxis response regulator CheY